MSRSSPAFDWFEEPYTSLITKEFYKPVMFGLTEYYCQRYLSAIFPTGSIGCDDYIPIGSDGDMAYFLSVGEADGIPLDAKFTIHGRYFCSDEPALCTMRVANLQRSSAILVPDGTIPAELPEFIYAKQVGSTAQWRFPIFRARNVLYYKNLLASCLEESGRTTGLSVVGMKQESMFKSIEISYNSHMDRPLPIHLVDLDRLYISHVADWKCDTSMIITPATRVAEYFRASLEAHMIASKFVDTPRINYSRRDRNDLLMGAVNAGLIGGDQEIDPISPAHDGVFFLRDRPRVVFLSEDPSVGDNRARIILNRHRSVESIVSSTISVDISDYRTSADFSTFTRPSELSRGPDPPPGWEIVDETTHTFHVEARLSRDYYLKFAALICATWSVLGALLAFAPSTIFWLNLKDSLNAASSLGVFVLSVIALHIEQIRAIQPDDEVV